MRLNNKNFENLLKIRYNAIGFIAFINLVFFSNYAVRETIYKYELGIIRIGHEKIDNLLIFICISISLAIFIFCYATSKSHSIINFEWTGNKLPLKLIFAASISVFVYYIIGTPATYLGVHFQLGQSGVANKLLGMIYIVLGNICILAISKGDIRRLILFSAPFVMVIILSLGMRSIYIVLISLPVMMLIFSPRAILWAPLIFSVLLAGAVVRSGYYSWNSLSLQANMLIWAPAYQIDVYASQNELANLVSQSYIAEGGGVGSFIALDFEQYIPSVNGLVMTSLFPASLLLLKKIPIFNAVTIALALFYPIAVRNNVESYLPVLILFTAGAASNFTNFASKNYKITKFREE